jgi:hypothetical protein
MHIVTTLIKADGKRIATHMIESTKSFQICRDLEVEYVLKKAKRKEREKQVSADFLDSLQTVQLVIYGKHETTAAVEKAVSEAISYNFTSLQEFNAILGLYNVYADRGPENGKIYKTGGLYYRVLNGRKEIVGKPIKASLMRLKPTLANLQERFIANKLIREPFKARIKTAIDRRIKMRPDTTLPELIHDLKSDGIYVVLRRNQNGLIYGITYVDVVRKAVFNGSELGKMYSAQGLLNRLLRQLATHPQIFETVLPTKVSYQNPSVDTTIRGQIREPELLFIKPIPVYPCEDLPYQLRTNRKKKKRKRNS